MGGSNANGQAQGDFRLPWDRAQLGLELGMMGSKHQWFAMAPASNGLDRLAQRPLAAPVQGRLQRRLLRSPLVLVVHGRSGGLIPEELQDWARELEQRRGAPVLLQALSSGDPDPGPGFWAGAQRAGSVGLVPLLLLPGGHVRKDVPAIARAWRSRLDPGPAIALQRYPFLGSWPAWQQLLAAKLADRQAFAAIHWLHHPLDGPLAQRYLAHLGAVLGSTGLATPYTAQLADLVLPVDRPEPGSVAVLPLTLASNRLTDTLEAGQRLALPPGQARPPSPFLPCCNSPPSASSYSRRLGPCHEQRRERPQRQRPRTRGAGCYGAR